jgi:hypothetical protein
LIEAVRLNAVFELFRLFRDCTQEFLATIHHHVTAFYDLLDLAQCQPIICRSIRYRLVEVSARLPCMHF